jgi:hypothetical protein
MLMLREVKVSRIKPKVVRQVRRKEDLTEISTF